MADEPLQAEGESGEVEAKVVYSPPADDTESEPEANTQEDLATSPDVQPGTDEQDKIPTGLKKYAAKRNFEAKQAKREAEAAQRELKELKEKLSKFEQSPEPEIPPVPDELDPDFREKLAAREAAIRDQEKWQTDQKQAEAQREADEWRREQLQLQQAQQEQEKREEQFRQRIVASNLEESEVVDALTKVQQTFLFQDSAGNVHDMMPEPLRQMLIEDDLSPLVAKIVAEDDSIAQELVSMNPYEAQLHLMTEVRPRAAQMKAKQTTQAPPPPETLDGGGTTEPENPLMKGAKFY